MAVTAASVKTLGGDAFAAIADSTVDTWIAIAAQRIDESVFDTYYDNAVSFLTLHMLQSFVLTGGTGGAVGVITGVTVGAISVSYASPIGGSAVVDAPYAGTAWGQQYLALRRIKYPGPFAA